MTCAVIGESRSLLRVIAITRALELKRKFGAAGRDNPALSHHVHDIRLDVIQEPLIVRDDDKSALRVAKAVDAFRDNSERVNVEPESVSSRTPTRGASSAICSTSNLFFSPPEKPTLSGRRSIS